MYLLCLESVVLTPTCIPTHVWNPHRIHTSTYKKNQNKETTDFLWLIFIYWSITNINKIWNVLSQRVQLKVSAQGCFEWTSYGVCWGGHVQAIAKYLNVWCDSDVSFKRHPGDGLFSCQTQIYNLKPDCTEISCHTFQQN